MLLITEATTRDKAGLSLRYLTIVSKNVENNVYHESLTINHLMIYFAFGLIDDKNRSNRFIDFKVKPPISL